MRINTSPLIRLCFTTSTVIRLFLIFIMETLTRRRDELRLLLFFSDPYVPLLLNVYICVLYFWLASLSHLFFFIHFFYSFSFVCYTLSITSSLPSSLQYLNMIMFLNLTVTGYRCEDTDSVLHKENKDRLQLEDSANLSLSLILFSSSLPPTSPLRGKDTEIMTRVDVID